jgi:hypothetical protein
MHHLDFSPSTTRTILPGNANRPSGECQMGSCAKTQNFLPSYRRVGETCFFALPKLLENMRFVLPYRGLQKGLPLDND